MSAHPPFFGNAQVFDIDPSEVETGERIGFLHTDKAAALGRLMAVDGQRDPIKVVKNRKGATRPWRLVTGMHRLHGAELEGNRVWAIEVIGKPEELADLEASENLHRRPLGPIERAKFTAALVQAAQERIAREHGQLSQQRLGAKVRWERVKAGETRAEQALQEEVDDAADKMSAAYGWQESVADALGLDKRTIRRDLNLFRLIIEPFPALAEALARHPVVGENGAQLKALADIKDEAHRRKAIEALLGDEELSAEGARVLVGIDRPAGRAPTTYEKFTGQIDGAWSRLNLTERRRFIPTLSAMLSTPELKRDMRDRLNEELGESGPKPAVLLRSSVKPDYIVCLEDGTRHTNLTTHLRRIGITPAEYRARWKLPADYPFLAPNYRCAREEAWRWRVLERRAQGRTDAR